MSAKHPTNPATPSAISVASSPAKTPRKDAGAERQPVSLQTAANRARDAEAYGVPEKMGILVQLQPVLPLNINSLLDRIMTNHEAVRERYAKKWETEQQN